jgi:hypothetical protein
MRDRALSCGGLVAPVTLGKAGISDRVHDEVLAAGPTGPGVPPHGRDVRRAGAGSESARRPLAVRTKVVLVLAGRLRALSRISAENKGSIV